MKKLYKAFKTEFLATVAEFAPYAVVNSEMKVAHFAWSYRSALAWVACYDAGNFGATWVFNFWNKPIAYKA